MKTDQQFREEANVLRLLGTLLTAGLPASDAFKIAGGEFPAAKTDLDVIRQRIMANDRGKPGLKLPVLSEQEPEPTTYLSVFVPPAIEAAFSVGTLDTAALYCAHVLERTAFMVRSGVEQSNIDLVNFYRIFEVLLCSGYPILKTLKLLGGHELVPSAVTEKLWNDIRDGETITGAAKCFPETFSVIDCASFDVGEQTGSLPEVLGQLADLKEVIVLASAPRPGSISIPADDERLAELVEFSHLALLIDAGVPILRALRIIADTSSISERKAAFADIAAMIEQGEMISEAMAQYSTVFKPYMVALIRAGETCGNLEDTTAYLTSYLAASLLGIEPSIPLKGALSNQG